ncbi:MAG: nitroreductase family deazaflavin-dependent oxidoreductase [Chloroflexi bacterium]|nr:MAG: nitroreductase family deazaflavin-dependent oxidoreductase [Chloroflexota bacterium]
MSQNASGTASSNRPRGMSRVMFRTLAAAHAFIYRRGMARKMGQMQQVLLTTTGRKSGQPQTVPLGAIREGDGWVVIASFNGADVHPGWWLNMLANPNVTLQVNDQVINTRMQEITNPADYERIWNAVVANLGRYATYRKKTSRKIPLGWLRPI